MEWSKTVVTRIHNILNVIVKKDERGRVERNFSALVFAPKGKVVYRMNGEEYVSDGTNVIYLPAGGIYIFEAFEDDVCPLINFECDFDRCEILSFPVSDISVYEKKFKKLREIYYNDNSPRAHHACLMALYDIMASLEGEYDEMGHGEYSRKAIAIMAERLFDPLLSNTEIAHALNISTVYFRKLFSDELGTPPMSYLRKMRIEKAMELLRIPEKSVGEIATEVGYSGIYPFSRVFKRETGMTPSDYAAKFKDAY